MRKTANVYRNVILIVLCCLLIVASCLAITGSWFTDHGKVKGTITKPVIQPTLVKGDSYEILSGPIYWSSESDNQNIYVKFDKNNNVNRQICRVKYCVEWGTIVNGIWVLKNNPPLNSSALTPITMNNWTAGMNSLSKEDYETLLKKSGITDETLQNLVDIGAYETLEQAKQEALTNLMDSKNCPITQYYYNDIINLKSIQGPIQICSGFKIDSNFSESAFQGYTAKITLSVEADTVSDRVIGKLQQVNDAFKGGYWIYNLENGTYLDDRPSDQLISNWKSQL